jgi:hypothetical protein
MAAHSVRTDPPPSRPDRLFFLILFLSLSSNYLLAFRYKLYISGTPVVTGSSRGLYRKATIPPRLDMVASTFECRLII